MSLAIPYILDAAAEVLPGATVHVAGRDLTIEGLNRRSVVRAERYLREGYQPGDHIPLSSLASIGEIVDALAAARVGLVVSDGAFTTVPRPDALGADREVIESRIWSETPAAIVGSRTLSHGDVIQAIDTLEPEGFEPLRPLLNATLR